MLCALPFPRYTLHSETHYCSGAPFAAGVSAPLSLLTGTKDTDSNLSVLSFQETAPQQQQMVFEGRQEIPQLPGVHPSEAQHDFFVDAGRRAWRACGPTGPCLGVGGVLVGPRGELSSGWEGFVLTGCAAASQVCGWHRYIHGREVELSLGRIDQ